MTSVYVGSWFEFMKIINKAVVPATTGWKFKVFVGPVVSTVGSR